ncbi:MAG: NUDIX hydrolase [Phycisphaerales bacterium]
MPEAALQAGVIPYRVRPDGTVQILLVTNRAGEWIVPKGKIDPGYSPQEAGRVEAYEEAGVIGYPDTQELGHYDYRKPNGLAYRVVLFPMPVMRQLEEWPEKAERSREWMTVDEAIRRIAFSNLRDVIERMERFEQHDAA